jgi:biotin carboxyl carrier protein
MIYDIKHGSDRIQLDIAARVPELLVAVDGATHTITEFAATGNQVGLRIDGRMFHGWRSVTPEYIEIRIEGQTFVFQRLEGVRAGDAAAESGDDVRAGMPGILVGCHAAAGEAVQRGAPLLTIESMKLQMTVSAPRDGIVARIHVAQDAAFERGTVLVSLEPMAARVEL